MALITFRCILVLSYYMRHTRVFHYIFSDFFTGLQWTIYYIHTPKIAQLVAVGYND